VFRPRSHLETHGGPESNEEPLHEEPGYMSADPFFIATTEIRKSLNGQEKLNHAESAENHWRGA